MTDRNQDFDPDIDFREKPPVAARQPGPPGRPAGKSAGHNIQWFPRLPDGRAYLNCDHADGRMATKRRDQVNAILSNITSHYEIGPEHTQLIEKLLDLEMMCMETNAVDPIASKDDKDIFIKIVTQITQLYGKLGLLEKRGETQTPYDLVEELKDRAPAYLEEMGFRHTIACTQCGHFMMVYFMRGAKFRFESESKLCNVLVDTGLSDRDASEVARILRGKFINGIGEWAIVPNSHPFLNSEKFPIWNDRLWKMTREKCHCGCGKPRMTRSEAAEVLEISEVGYDQLSQQREQNEQDNKGD